MPPRNMSLTPMIQMKPTNVLIAGTFLVVANLASAQHCRNIDINKTSGFCTVPDPKLTPGEMDPTQACVSNTENALSVSAVYSSCRVQRKLGWNLLDRKFNPGT
jgi:hypothetical protein